MSQLFTLDQTIAADPSRVFARLTDVDHWHEWVPNLVGIERLNDKPMGLGFAWRETRKRFGGQATDSYEVTLFEADSAFAVTSKGVKGSLGAAETYVRYDLIPKGGLTHLAVLCEVDGLGSWEALKFWMFGGTMKKALAADVAALRRYIERVKMDWHDGNM